jgi:cytoskeletal protein CcmA (bactofilin family)
MSDPKGTGKVTLVEEGTQFKGSLSSNCPVEVKGRVEGDLTAPSLIVSVTGQVHGKVKAGEIHSQGELAGELDADVVQLSGVVRDNTVIRARSLEVKLAPLHGKMQVIFGECELDIGGEAAPKEVASEKEQPRPKKGSMRPRAAEERPADAPVEAAPVAEKRPSVAPPNGDKRASIPPPADLNGAS